MSIFDVVEIHINSERSTSSLLFYSTVQQLFGDAVESEDVSIA